MLDLVNKHKERAKERSEYYLNNNVEDIIVRYVKDFNIKWKGQEHKDYVDLGYTIKGIIQRHKKINRYK